MQVPIDERNVEAGTIVWRDPDTGERFETPVTGGHAKLQWKPDWAMRWAALGVDYEMSGKDLIDSVKLAAQICRALGAPPPEGFNYELFLDENGQKISKSKGNGLTIDEWLTYAPTESLGLYMFQKPKTAKKLYFDVIPKAVDEYYTFLAAYPRQDWKERLGNPVWHMHDGNPPVIDLPVPFALLLNLVSASNAQNKAVLWGFISRYAPGVTPETHPELDRLAGYAIRYFEDFVKPAKVYRAPDDVERQALANLSDALAALPADADGEAIQNAALNVARKIERYQDHAKQSPEGGPGVSVAFFQMIYQVLIGQERGPRFGSFAALYGIAETARSDRQGAGRRAPPQPEPDQFVAAGGGPKMPILAARAFSSAIAYGPPATARAQPFATSQAPTSCLPRRQPATRNCRSASGGTRHDSALPRSHKRTAVRARTPHGHSRRRICRSAPDRRFRFRRSLSCSPSPRTRPRRWQPGDKGWCRPNRPACTGGGGSAWPSGPSGSRGGSRTSVA